MNVLDKLVDTYRRTGYFERYGGSIFMTILLIIAFYIAISFFYTISNITNIKNNWEEHRCKYHILPFAGVIKRPKNTSIREYTNKNLGYCLNKSMDNTTNIMLTPLYFATSVVFIVIKSITGLFQLVFKEIIAIVKIIDGVLEAVKGYSVNVLFEFQKILLMIRDSIQKTFGIFSAIIFFMISVVFLLVGFISSAYHTGIALIIIITTVMVGAEMAIPIVGPILAALTAAFAAAMGIILHPFGELVDCLIQTPIGCNYNLKVKNNPQPTKCPKNYPKNMPCNTCFHPNTTLQLVDNTPVLIKDIKINDILHDHTRVNGIVKLVNQKETFYKLNDILVTGEHFVEFNHTWIRVKHHPDAIKQSIDTEFVYCLSTTTNKIPIGNYVFHDWNDDLIQENELCKQSIYYSTNIIHENCNIDKHLAKDIPMYSKIQDSQVLGILHIQLDTTTYVIHDAIVNEYQKVFHNNKWVCAKDYPDKQVYKKGPQRLIGFITDKKKIKINDIVFQDEYYI